jgi:UPF0755 protein
MKGRRAFFVAAAGLLAVMAAAEIYHQLGVPLRVRAEPRPFTINRGETLDEVLDRLESEEIVRSARPLRFYARLRGWDRRVRAGRYMIGAGMPAAEILQTLVEGPRLLQKVTLPEGLPLQEAFGILSDSLKIPDVSLEGVSGDTTWLLSLDLPIPNLEGYLYPETYHFDPGTSERIVIEHLVKSALEYFTPEKIQRAKELGLSIHEVMTLASIVEAEAKVPEERSRISAVFHRRLERGFPLQADPTVQYAVGKVGEPPTTDDLSVPSPYNTYLIQGLPPGPINSPGAASLDAALWPLESCNDLYFVARPDGSHIFSRTLREHEAARQTVRRLKRQSGR